MTWCGLRVKGNQLRVTQLDILKFRPATRNSENLHKIDRNSKNKLYGNREIETMEFETAFSI